MIKMAYVLVLIWSPISPYFNGVTYEVRDTQQICLDEIEKRIGETLDHIGAIGWEKEMMGPVPKVIGGYCASGGFAPNAFDAHR